MSSSVDVPGKGGVLYLGVQLSAVLWGITLFQCWNYCLSGCQDGLFVQATVLLVWLLNTVHQSLIAYAVWYYLVRNFSNPKAFHTEVPAVLWELGVASILTFLVQSLYVWRLWILSHKNKWLVFILCGIVTVNFALSLGTMIYTLVIRARFNNRSDEGVITSSLAFIVLTDVSITLSMCYYLYRSYTDFSQTESLVQTLFVYTISTGLLPSIVVIAIIICRLVEVHTLAYMALHFVISGLYANSVLFLLNNRRNVLEKKREQALHYLSYTEFEANRDVLEQTNVPGSQDSGSVFAKKTRVPGAVEVVVA